MDYGDKREETEIHLKQLIDWTEHVHKMAQDGLYYLDSGDYELTRSGVLTPASRAILLQLFGTLPSLVGALSSALRVNDPVATDAALLAFSESLRVELNIVWEVSNATRKRPDQPRRKI